MQFVAEGGEVPQLSAEQRKTASQLYIDVVSNQRELWNALGDEAQSRFRLAVGVESLPPVKRPEKADRTWRATSKRRAPQRQGERAIPDKHTAGSSPVSNRSERHPRKVRSVRTV